MKTQMGEYIKQILKQDKIVVMSWGANNFVDKEDGLSFKVNGFLHKGWVNITYNEGFDCFEITYTDKDNKESVLEKDTFVYIYNLIEVIDNKIEFTNPTDYEERVNKEYSD